jgi:hypothetical protein
MQVKLAFYRMGLFHACVIAKFSEEKIHIKTADTLSCTIRHMVENIDNLWNLSQFMPASTAQLK